MFAYFLFDCTDSITSMHSSRIRTVRSSSFAGGLLQGPPRAEPPGSRPPQTRHLPAARHAGIAHPPCCKACWDTTCNACWDSTPPLQGMLGYHPPVNRMTNTCKNITLPQTSFAGGNSLETLQLWMSAYRVARGYRSCHI